MQKEIRRTERTVRNMNQHTQIIHELTQSVKRKDKIMNTAYHKYTSASDLAQDISIDLENLKDLTFVFQEFTDGERRDLAQSSTAKSFLARYPMQEAMQKAISDSILGIAQDVETLVDMLMERDQQDRHNKAAQA
nr:hypothetical protein [uncultured Blautia sp.]